MAAKAVDADLVLHQKVAMVVDVLHAMAAVVGAFLLPVGILLEIPYGVVGSVVADGGGFVVIISLLVMLLGLLRYMRSAGEGQA